MPDHLRCNRFGEIQTLLCEHIIEILPEDILAAWDGLGEDGLGVRGELPAFIEQRRDIVVRCGEGRPYGRPEPLLIALAPIIFGQQPSRCKGFIHLERLQQTTLGTLEIFVLFGKPREL